MCVVDSHTRNTSMHRWSFRTNKFCVVKFAHALANLIYGFCAHFSNGSTHWSIHTVSSLELTHFSYRTSSARLKQQSQSASASRCCNYLSKLAKCQPSASCFACVCAFDARITGVQLTKQTATRRCALREIYNTKNLTYQWLVITHRRVYLHQHTAIVAEHNAINNILRKKREKNKRIWRRERSMNDCCTCLSSLLFNTFHFCHSKYSLLRRPQTEEISLSMVNNRRAKHINKNKNRNEMFVRAALVTRAPVTWIHVNSFQRISRQIKY